MSPFRNILIKTLFQYNFLMIQYYFIVNGSKGRNQANLLSEIESKMGHKQCIHYSPLHNSLPLFVKHVHFHPQRTGIS